MGQLFSRAFKRITQGGHSRSPSNQSQQRIEQQDLRDKPDSDQRTLSGPSEAIAVGQSIDSAEYAALETNESNTTNNNNDDNLQEREENKENTAATSPTANGTNDKDKQDVEEAVIKIQALFRGHLTRKALKDAHQQSVPPANALGQSQFDEDSLIRNPPSAIFSSASPLNLAGDREHQASENNNQPRTPLASIAEVTETPGSRLEAGDAGDNGESASSQTSASGRKKLAALSTRKTPSPSILEVGVGDSGASRGSSPAPSHASIDLGVPASFSASIDILDHNLKPTDRFAAVLHHREEPPKNVPAAQPPGSLPSAPRQAPPTISTPDDDGRGRTAGTDDEIEERRMTMPAGTPDSLASIESEEAAAVRIQSAFRGYRTRKNSPYRTRSPNDNNSNPNSPLVGAAPTSPSLEPAAASNDDLDKRVNDTNMAASEGTEERRTSRPRHRNEDGEEMEAIEEQVGVNPADEEITTTGTTDASEGTVKQLTLAHPSRAVESTAAEAAAADAARQSSEDSTTSLSFDIGQSEANTLDTSEGPTGGISSAALETGPQAYSSLDVGGQSIAAGGAATSPASLAAQKQPIGGGRTKESRASIDTDSSILGAALSLNEADISVAEQSSVVQPASVPTVAMLEQIDEDKSLGISVASEQLELEARKLVDELTGDSRDRSGQSNENDECALEEATNELEEALEEATAEDGGATATEPASLLLSSAVGSDQLAQLELDSDEIERRDPCGGNLAVEALDEALGGSGGSSLGASSSSDDDENKGQQQQRQQNQQHQQQQQQAGANKNKKKNRNKRKGKK